MSALSKAFNVGAVQGGHYQRMDVTLTWDSDVPMEFRLHMWQPAEDGEGSTVIWSVSRDLLIEVTAEDAGIADHTGTGVAKFGAGDVTAARIRVPAAGMDDARISLESDAGEISFSLATEPLAAFVRTSLHKCPTESEAVDVDGLIHQIFNAEEADQ